MSDEALTAIGSPEIPGLVAGGDDVVYLPEIPLYGPMEFYRVAQRGGRLIVRLDSGEFETFEPHELSTPEAVAKHAAAALDQAEV